MLQCSTKKVKKKYGRIFFTMNLLFKKILLPYMATMETSFCLFTGYLFSVTNEHTLLFAKIIKQGPYLISLAYCAYELYTQA